MPDVKEKSIVTIIQNMLSSGESADKILVTLKEMGVQEEQAKTLLMMAQTNTFAVLKGDIANVVNEEINKQYPNFEKQLNDFVNKKTFDSQQTISTNVLATLKNDQQNYQTNQKKMVDKVVNVSVEQDTKIENIKNKLNELGANYDKLALGSTKSVIYLRIASFVIGIVLAVFLVYKWFGLTPGYSIDYLIFYVIIGLLVAILIVLSLI